MKQNRKTQTPDGVYDYLPKESRLKSYFSDKIIFEFKSWGYEKTEVPVLEFLDVYQGTQNYEFADKIFKTVDNKGRLLALRPDITTSVARMAATKMKNEPMPLKLYYKGDVFTCGVTEAHKAAQSTQIGVELIGDSSYEADAEVIALAISSLLKCGFDNFQIEIGQVAFFKGLMLEAGLDKARTEAVRELVEQKNMLGIELLLADLTVKESVGKVIKQLPYLFGGVEILSSARSTTSQSMCLEALDNLQQIYNCLKDYGLEQYLSFDLGMVQGLDYYSGVIFRGIVPGLGKAVLQGGRYDNLLGAFGDDRAATGFAIELLRLLETVSPTEPVLPQGTDYLLGYSHERAKAYAKAKELREKGFNVRVDRFDSEEALQKAANARRIKAAMFIK